MSILKIVIPVTLRLFIHHFYLQTLKIPWKDFLTSLPIWSIVVAHVCNNWGNYTLMTCLPSYMRDVLKFDMKSVSHMSMKKGKLFFYSTGCLKKNLAAHLNLNKTESCFPRRVNLACHRQLIGSTVLFFFQCQEDHTEKDGLSFLTG
jgi:hypothetical protein